MRLFQVLVNRVKAVTSILALLFVFAACDQNSTLVDIESGTSPTASIEPPVTVVDGRLVFSDMEAFSQLMDDLILSGRPEIGEIGLTDKFASLRSSTAELQMRNGQESGNAEYLSDIDYEIVEDPYFAEVLNEHGEIQIGSDVFKVTRNYVYQTSVSNIGLLSKISVRNADQSPFLDKNNNIGSISTHEIERGVSDTVSEGTNKTSATINCTSDFQTGGRIHGSSWMTSYWFYSSAGVRTKAQRKRLFWWISTTVNELSFETTYTFYSSNPSVSPVSETVT